MSKPSIKEIMDQTGVDFITASELLYGSVGSNEDTRDWDAITSSGLSGQELVDTVAAATNEMYGGVTVQVNDAGQQLLVGGNGTLLRVLQVNTDPNIGKGQMQKQLSVFGVRDSSWVNQDWNAVANNNINTINTKVERFQGILSDPNATSEAKAEAQEYINSAPRLIKVQQELPARMEVVKGWGEEVYAPLSDWQNTTGLNLITGLSQAAAARQVEQALKREEEDVGVVEQTITPFPQQTQPVPPPTYTPPPQVQAPVSQTPAPTFPSSLPTQTPPSGTFPGPLQTGGISAAPGSVTFRPNYTGTTMTQLTSPSQGQAGVQQVAYGNSLGQTLTVTEVNGQPMTYVPPGFTRMSGQTQQQQFRPQNQQLQWNSGSGVGSALAKGVVGSLLGFNQGGSVENDAELDAMYRMATKFLGYRGPRSRKSLEDFAKSSPGAAAKMKSYTAAMAKGGMVRKGYQAGGQVTENDLADMSGNLVRQTLQPMQAPMAFIQPEAADFISPTAGQTVPQAPFAETATVGAVEQAQLPQFITPATFQAQQAAPQVAEETARTQAAQGQVSQQAQVQAAQQQGTSLSDMQAAQASAIMLQNPMQREIQQGELISGTAVDANKVEALNAQMQAATATPTEQATVQGQLEGLMTQFEGGQTPAWAAGAMRNATAMLAARGLGASSLAGQAVIQATMESALPIAMADAQTRAQFEAQNLSNRQQTAMMAAQQRAAFLQLEFDQEFQSRVQNASRIADVANMNFTAEQQIALENSRIANTTNLQNLNNRQAMVMAEAASLANLDMANLNNRQQAAVQNAQNFLQMDLTNLNNEQQTGLFRAQQNIQALFTDQAAENAAQQFNAASENQTNQFFSNLNTQVSQFNATQRNAMDQFNVNSVNAMRQFNSEVQQQRDLFNAQNGLVVAQANAQWRQNIATLNNATQNQSNMDFAKTINALTSTNLDQIWQRERDIMNYAFTQSETSMDRALSILLADKELDAYREKMAADQKDAKYALATSVILEWAK